MWEQQNGGFLLVEEQAEPPGTHNTKTATVTKNTMQNIYVTRNTSFRNGTLPSRFSFAIAYGMEDVTKSS